ncbi:MAG: hypothetical protein R3A44_34405 [Caldilineaceae bacterium]
MPLGKILRIDVDGSSGGAPDCSTATGTNYRIPADNPFVDGAGGPATKSGPPVCATRGALALTG